MPRFPASVRAAARLHTDAILRLPNVFAVGVGSKRVRGVVTGEPGVVTYVTRKLPADALSQAERVPTHLEADGEVVPTDVLEAAQPRFVAVDTATYRPVRGGCQIGTSSGAGTAGAVMYDRRDQRLVLLTNNHVLTGLTQPWTLPANTTVQQPFGGAAIGFSKRIVPMLPAPLGATGYKYFATVDAGIVELNGDVTSAFDVLEIGRHPFVVLPPFEGLDVVRRGYRTQLRTGTVESVDMTVIIKAGNGDLIQVGGDDAVFSIRSPERLISAMPGDSGSLVVDAAGGAARGLVFASDSQSGGVTWACELGTVTQLLELDTPCTGGLAAAIRRAVVRRSTTWASAHTAAEGGHRNWMVDEVVKTVGRFRDRHLPAEPDGTLGSAIGGALQRLGPDLADALTHNEDAAGLFDRAFGEWFVQPTVFDMLEYRFPEDTAERVSAALCCLRDTCSAREDLELLTSAFGSAAGRSMREMLRGSTSDVCNRINSAARGTA